MIEHLVSFDRTRRWLLPLTATAFSAGCASAPPPKPAPPAPVIPVKTAAWLAMGFEKTDEG